MALPNPFQNATLPSPVLNATSKSTQNNASCFHGYRSNFNIDEQKKVYQERMSQQLEQNPKINRNPQQRIDRSSTNEKANQNYGSDSSNWCELCECGFKFPHQLEKHMIEHEKCWFDNCNFEGHSKLLLKHVETQHQSAIFQRIGKIETDEDIEKWREERRKRYPTKANIEARRQAQEERMKRGERIQEPNNRFGNVNNRKSAQHHSIAQNHDESMKTQSGKKKQDRKRRRTRNKNNKGDKNDEQMPNEITKTESVKSEPVINTVTANQNPVEPQEKTASITNSLAAIMGMYGSDSDSDCVDDGETVSECKQGEHDAAGVSTVESAPVTSDLNSVATESDKCGADEFTGITRKRTTNSGDELPIKQLKIDSTVLVEPMQQDLENASDDDAPEEEPIQKQPSKDDDQPEVASGPTQIKPQQKLTLTNEKQRKRRTILDTTRKIRNQNTLLEKLLQKDIRHERNVLLQCVRFVVANGFFGIEKQNTDEQNASEETIKQ